MSRDINPDKLSKDDKQYLRDRPDLVASYANAGIDLDLGDVEDQPGPEDVQKLEAFGDLQRQYADLFNETERLREENSRLQALLQQAGEHPDQQSEDDDDEEESYEDLTVDQLKEEIDARNEDKGDDDKLSKSGNKAELIERLEADDAAAEAEGSDES